MLETKDDQESNTIAYVIFASLGLIAIIGVCVMGVFSFNERLQSSIVDLVRVNERIMDLTDKVKLTGDTALSGSREAHERIDRLYTAIMAQDAALSKVKKSIRRIDEDVEGLKTLARFEENVREETQEAPGSPKPKEPDAPYPPPY